MTTKKKSSRGDSQGSHPRGEAATESYEEAVKVFAGACDSMYAGRYADAKEVFDRIASENPDEPVLTERAVTYARICERHLAMAEPEPTTPGDQYYRAVVLCNNGQFDESIHLLDQALADSPTSARYLYARASARALKGDADAAVTDLRQAIAADPQTRFQAANDRDFERIREEPNFIDVIEPSPTGA